MDGLDIVLSGGLSFRGGLSCHGGLKPLCILCVNSFVVFYCTIDDISLLTFELFFDFLDY